MIEKGVVKKSKGTGENQAEKDKQCRRSNENQHADNGPGYFQATEISRGEDPSGLQCWESLKVSINFRTAVRRPV